MDEAQRERIEATIRALVVAITDAGPRITYERLVGDRGQRHEWLVYVGRPALGPLLGRGGKHAEYLRELIRVRAKLLGVRDAIDARFLFDPQSE